MRVDVNTLRRQLATSIAMHAMRNGDHKTAVPGLALTRHSSQTVCYRAHCSPAVIVFAQGKKRMELGGIDYVCDSSSFFLSSIDVPVQSTILEATKKAPMLAMRIELEMDSVREMLQDEDFVPPKVTPGRVGLSVGTTTAGLLSACVRLVGLLDTPEDIAYISTLLQKEIVYRVLRTPQAQSLRAVVTNGDLSAQTARVMTWLRKNYAKPLHMDELASLAHMGVSTLHHQFRALTCMTPLQYQKQIRLQTARELMLMDDLDAASAAFAVGYGSVSQFSREYSRHFGLPPMRDVVAARERQETITSE